MPIKQKDLAGNVYKTKWYGGGMLAKQNGRVGSVYKVKG